MELIYILKSKSVFYTVFFLILLSSFVYKKMVKEIKMYLNLLENRMTNSEIWEMVKDESSKGNIKAKIAFFAYCLSTFCLILMGLLICLVNV